jgi:hypothetical protein
MENPILSFFIFVVVVFLYIHIVAQWKKSEDLEIYETDYTNVQQLREVCSVRQPVLFVFPVSQSPVFESIQIANMSKFESLNVKVKDVYDYWKPSASYSDRVDSVDSVALSFRSARRLFETEQNSRYISENNAEFLEESGLERVLSDMDEYLKPAFCLYSKQDLLFGSKHATTPLRYHTNASYFVIPTRGKITVKMTPWKSSKYLHSVKDYEYYEFWSRVNVWNPHSSHKHNMDKLQFLEFDVLPGYILYVPPYWWYSIRVSTDPENCVCAITYDTAINALAHSYNWGMFYLQQTNIYTRVSSRPVLSIDSAIDGVSSVAENVPEQSGAPTDANSPEMADTPNTTPPAPKPVEHKEIITNMGVYHV